MTPARLDLQIIQGATLRQVLRIMQPVLEYRAITAIAATAPVQLTVTHGLPTDWPVWVRGVQRMPALNAEPIRQRPHFATVIDADTLDINPLSATGLTPQGGELVYYLPVDLTGATAALRVLDASGAELLALAPTVNAGGWVELELTDEQTAALTWLEGDWLLDIALPNGDVVRAFAGDARVWPAGSLPSNQSVGGWVVTAGAQGVAGAPGPAGPSVWGGITGDIALQEDVAGAIDSKITSSSRTDTATSGAGSTSTLAVSVAPTANSTRVSFGKKVELTYSSSFNITTGGYVSAGQDVLNTAGTGTLDKLVGRVTQLNLSGGNVAAAVGVEAVLSTVGASTMVAGYAAFYSPNLSSVPNISNVDQLAAFQNDEPRAHILNAGKYLDADLIEFSPPYHIGVVAGRYYSAPARSMTQSAMTANVIYVTYVSVPKRTTITKLGFNVTVAAAGDAIVGLYKVKDSTITTLVAQTGSISTATTGEKEGTVSAAVNAGTYAIVAVFSGTPTIYWHEIATHHAIGAASSTGYSEFAYIPFAFGALPATANALPTFAANTIEPHLWYRL